MSTRPLTPTVTPFRPDAFRLEVRPRRREVHICLFGELDMSTSGSVDRQLTELRGAGWDDLVIDLRGLTFICSDGLHLMLRWTGAAEEEGFTLRLVPGGPAVQRLFDLTGLAGSLPFTSDPREHPLWR